MVDASCSSYLVILNSISDLAALSFKTRNYIEQEMRDRNVQADESADMCRGYENC